MRINPVTAEVLAVEDIEGEDPDSTQAGTRPYRGPMKKSELKTIISQMTAQLNEFHIEIERLRASCQCGDPAAPGVNHRQISACWQRVKGQRTDLPVYRPHDFEVPSS